MTNKLGLTAAMAVATSADPRPGAFRSSRTPDELTAVCTLDPVWDAAQDGTR